MHTRLLPPWTLSSSSTGVHGLEFSGPGPARTKDKNFGLTQKRSDNFNPRLEHNTKSLPHQFFSDFSPGCLDLRDFKTNLFNLQHIMNIFLMMVFFFTGTQKNLFHFCQPNPAGPAHWEKSPLICWPCPARLKNISYSPAQTHSDLCRPDCAVKDNKLKRCILNSKFY